MSSFYQPKPDSESLGFKETDLDKLSDDEILKLINGTGRVRVSPQQRPKPKGYVDLDALIGGGE